MKKNSSTAHNSKFSRVVCMLLVTVLLCGLGWTGIVASAESMQAGSAVSEQIADNMTEGAVETEQPAPTEAPEHMGELPTMDEALGLVAAPQGQTADGVYYFGEQTDTDGLYVKVEVIDKSEGAVLPEGAQLKLKASEKAAEYVRQSILKKAELADDEFFFLYDLSFVDKDGKEIDVGTGSGKSFKVTVYMAGEGNNFADAEGSLNVVSLPYTIGELETAEDIKLEEAEKKAAEEPQTEDKPAEAEPAQTEQPAAEEKAEPVTEDKAEEPTPAEEPAKAEEANEAKAEEKVEEKAEEKTEETEKSVIPARETKVVVSDLLKVDVSYTFNTNGLGVFAFYGKKATDKIDYQKLYDDLMACETVSEVNALCDELTDEEIEEFEAWLTENGKSDELDEHFRSVKPEGDPVEAPIVSFGNVGPLRFAPVTRRARMLRAAADNDGKDKGVVLNKTAEATEDGYKITMEAYVTGESTTTTSVEPVDIVLVLDVSGSMDDTMDEYRAVYDVSTRNSYYVIVGGVYTEVEYEYIPFKGYEWGYWSGLYWYSFTPKTSANDTDSDHVQFYEKITGTTKKMAALKTAVSSFISSVAAQSPESQIAIVKFAGDKSYSVGNGTYRDGRYTYNYSQIVRNLTTVATGSGNLQDAVNALSPAGATSADYGMQHAQTIIDSVKNDKRKKVVIMFTDGEPNHSSGFSETVANDAISASKGIKDAGATVYTIGVFGGADGNPGNAGSTSQTNKYMHYVSSNFKNATGMSNPGSSTFPDGGKSYFLSAANAGDLNVIFNRISQEIGGSTIKLDSESYVKDVVTEQFTMPEGTDAVKIYTVDCIGDHRFDEKTKTDVTDKVVYTIEGNTVTVKGFDYSANYCGPRNGVYSGKKLVVEFTVKAKEAFLGGNDVPTNVGTDDAIYNKEGTKVDSFIPPDVNVPIKGITVTAQDKNIYLLGGLTADQLKGDATVMVGNVSLKLGEPNFGLEAWQNEFVDITVTVMDKDGKAVTDLSNLTDDTTYKIMVTVSPKTPDPKSTIGPKAVAKSDEGSANIYVFKPEVTFKDSVENYGKDVDKTYYETANKAGTVWKHGTTDAAKADMIGTEPKLDYTYGPASAKLATDDLPVKVALVKIVSTDVTEHVTFKHEDCTHSGCEWNEHYAAGKDKAGQAHFIIHVNKIKIIITKVVEGNFGDKLKNFSFAYKIGNGDEVTFNLRNGESTIPAITVPVGAIFTLTEATDGTYSTVFKYVDTQLSSKTVNNGVQVSFKVEEGKDKVTVTNTRNTTPDMGVSLDSLPYIIVLAAVAVAAVVIILRKRRNNDD